MLPSRPLPLCTLVFPALGLARARRGQPPPQTGRCQHHDRPPHPPCNAARARSAESALVPASRPLAACVAWGIWTALKALILSNSVPKTSRTVVLLYCRTLSCSRLPLCLQTLCLVPPPMRGKVLFRPDDLLARQPICSPPCSALSPESPSCDQHCDHLVSPGATRPRSACPITPGKRIVAPHPPPTAAPVCPPIIDEIPFDPPFDALSMARHGTKNTTRDCSGPAAVGPAHETPPA